MTPTDPQIILDAYTACTGREASFLHYEFSIGKFTMMGFTAADMTLVCEHIKRENRKHGRDFQISLKLSRLLSDTEWFSDFLAEARAKQRNHIPNPTPKEKVLQSFRPTLSEPMPGDTALSAGECLKRFKAAI